jgi:hypothetical protein
MTIAADQIAQDARPIQSITVELETADIRTLDTIPVELVPAPPLGQMIVPQSYFAQGNISVAFADALVKVGFSGSPPLQVLTSAGIALDYLTEQVAINPLATFSGDRSAVENNSLVAYATTPTVITSGPIATSSKAVGGADYVMGDTGTIDAGNGLAAYVVDTVDGGGAVLTYHLTNNGDEYEEDTGVATIAGGAQAGIGTGFTIDIDSVTPPAEGEGSVILTIFYSIVDLQ